MIYVYIFVGVLIVCGITFCILYGNAILKPVIKMQKKDTINLVLKILGISIGITIIFYAFKYLIAD